MPPSWSGIATYSDLLLDGLAEDWELTVMVGDDETLPSHRSAKRFVHHSSERWLFEVDPPDRMLCALGNSFYHRHVPGLLLRHGGVVLAHDVRMNALQCFRAQEAPQRDFLSSAIDRRYGWRLGSEFRAFESRGGVASHFGAVRARMDEANLYLLGEAVRGADQVAVHSNAAKRLAELDLEETIPVVKVPFGHSDRDGTPTSAPNYTVSTFGFVAHEKAPVALLQAFANVHQACPQSELRYVGHVDPVFEQELIATADALGLAEVVTFTGRLDGAAYRLELSRASVAVQLRAASNGEASAAIADTMSQGIPTIVTGIGAQCEFPDNAVVKVNPGNNSAEVSAAILSVLELPHMSAGLRDGAILHSSGSSFGHAAKALTTLLVDCPRLR